MLLSPPTCTVPPTQAEAFQRQYGAYWFSPSHLLVELEAASQAQETAPRLFRFADGSRLHVDAVQRRVVVD